MFWVEKTLKYPVSFSQHFLQRLSQDSLGLSTKSARRAFGSERFGMCYLDNWAEYVHYYQHGGVTYDYGKEHEIHFNLENDGQFPLFSKSWIQKNIGFVQATASNTLMQMHFGPTDVFSSFWENQNDDMFDMDWGVSDYLAKWPSTFHFCTFALKEREQNQAF